MLVVITFIGSILEFRFLTMLYDIDGGNTGSAAERAGLLAPSTARDRSEVPE
jgi:hypothetical protein